MHSFGMKYVKNMLLYLNVLVIIWLLVTYTLLFGLSSLEKYCGKEVNIVQKEENPTAIDPPGEFIEYGRWWIPKWEYIEAVPLATILGFSCHKMISMTLIM